MQPAWLDYALPLIKAREGCRLTAYPDPGTGGAPWTIGYGCTGEGIGEGTRWTQAQADQSLVDRLTREVNPAVTAAVRVRLTPKMRAALTSLAYNIGVGAFARSTLVRLLNADDYAGAAEQFAVWRRAGGKVLAGLVARRAAERALFLEGVEDLA